MITCPYCRQRHGTRDHGPVAVAACPLVEPGVRLDSIVVDGTAHRRHVESTGIAVCVPCLVVWPCDHVYAHTNLDTFTATLEGTQ